MSEEVKKDVGTEKEKSKTEQYKEHVQKIIYQELGVKVSKDKAWGLLKAIIHGTVEHVVHVDGKKLPLAGVGTFEILETKPRGSKAGLDKEGKQIEGAEAWPCVPRFRFYPSSVIDNYVEASYGLGDHEIEEKHYGIYRSEEDQQAVKEGSKKAEKKSGKDEDSKAEATTEDSGSKSDEFDGLDEL